jgi:hypothetical protein
LLTSPSRAPSARSAACARGRRASRGRAAGLQPRERVVSREDRDRCSSGIELHGHDDVGLRRDIQAAKLRRHDADDVRRLPVHDELAPERRRLAGEAGLPKRMRQDHRIRGTRGSPVLLLREPAAAHRLHAERLKQAVRDAKRAYPHRLLAARERLATVVPQADLGERAALLPVREVHSRRTVIYAAKCSNCFSSARRVKLCPIENSFRSDSVILSIPLPQPNVTVAMPRVPPVNTVSPTTSPNLR